MPPSSRAPRATADATTGLAGLRATTGMPAITALPVGRTTAAGRDYFHSRRGQESTRKGSVAAATLPFRTFHPAARPQAANRRDSTSLTVLATQHGQPLRQNLF